MVTARWISVDDPESFARDVLQDEAPEIPVSVLKGRSWEQVRLPLLNLTVDELMVAEHDAEPVHRHRRDRFRHAILMGAELPPLIVVKSDLHLVDGYARLRALRSLAIEEVSVVRQVIL